jgi:hypothetical protein
MQQAQQQPVVDNGNGQVAEPQQAPTAIPMEMLQAPQQGAVGAGGNRNVSADASKVAGVGAVAGAGNRSVPAAVAAKPVARPEDAPIDGNALLQEIIAASQQGTPAVVSPATATVAANPAEEPVTNAAVVSDGVDNGWMLPAAAAAALPAALAVPGPKGTAVANPAAAAVGQPNANTPKSNVIDADFRVVNDPMNLAAGDKSLALPAKEEVKKLNGPQANQAVADTTGKTALPAPAEKPPIAGTDTTSGKTIQAESGILDKSRAKMYNFGGSDMWIQGTEVFDKSGKYVGQASKVFPPHVQGMMRTLGLIKRGK